jgi:hypothetical protein
LISQFLEFLGFSQPQTVESTDLPLRQDLFAKKRFNDRSKGFIETFEKCSILFKFKAGENFNHPDEIGTGIHTLSILRIKI